MRKIILLILTLFSLNGLDALPECRFCEHGYATIDFLWWRGECDNFSAFETETTGTANDREVRTLSYNWDPGFRIGLDTQCAIGDLIYAPYFTATHFRSTGQQSFEIAPSTSVNTISLITILNQPLEATPAAGSTFNYTASIDFLYNQYDLGISKILCDGASIMIIPKFGFSYLNTRQAFNNQVLVTATQDTGNVTDYAKNTYSGFGAILGMESHYKMIPGLTLYTSLDLSGYVGRNKVATTLQQSATRTSGVFASKTLITEKDTQGRWLSDIQIGVQYQTKLFNSLELAGRIGWEFIYIPDLVDFIPFVLTPQAFKINGLVFGIVAGF